MVLKKDDNPDIGTHVYSKIGDLFCFQKTWLFQKRHVFLPLQISSDSKVPSNLRTMVYTQYFYLKS